MSDASRQMVPSPSEDSTHDDYGPDRYGESFADVYDEWYDDVSDAQATAAFVNRFGESQRVLELGVGTGRLSTPLAEQGHSVVGIDASTAMLERFHNHANAWAVGANMRSLPVSADSFDTVLIATNTLFNLGTDVAQAACFTECRRALRLGGRLIVEAMVPGEPDPALDRLVTTRSIDIRSAVLTATIRDTDEQQITGQHIEISENGIRMRPWRIRYATLPQLDDMASAAGFRLGERVASWSGEPLVASSANAVGVYVAV